MKKNFSRKWDTTKSPAKQRKYRAKAPLHIKRKFMSINLIKPLREKHKKRALPVRAGDRVKILRGNYRGQEGKVERVDSKNSKVYIEKIRVTKRDGSETSYPINPSNLQIVTLVMDDKFRQKERKVAEKKKTAGKKPAKPEEKTKK